MDDPSLTVPVEKAEQAFVQELLSKHGPEQVAAALIRMQLAGQPAPEELGDNGSTQTSERASSNMQDGVWVSLTVGRKQNAEPRWLLPMLCRAGHITKNDIGSIKIQQDETFVEISGKKIEIFLGALGADMDIEKGITVSRIKGAPDIKDSPRGPRGPRKPRQGKPSENRSDRDRPSRTRERNHSRPKDGEREGGREQNRERSHEGKRDFKRDSKPAYKPKAEKSETRQEPADARKTKKPKKSKKVIRGKLQKKAKMADKSGNSPLTRKRT